DQGGGVFSLVTLPRFLLTGKKNPFAFFPPAGIKQEDIDGASRFGERLNIALKNSEETSFKPLLKNMGAVSVNGKLIATEKIANRSFQIWSRLIKLSGKKYSFGRKVTISIYVVFLITLLLTVVPLNILARKILNIFQKDRLKKLEEYYELPSGR
ncbi:MAG: dialkylresorcinol condensing enzyme, partial [Campylobacterota bacterium]|nr:dialkylresorcinol condensing enzyme [Campylobacterota bacterium]